MFGQSFALLFGQNLRPQPEHKQELVVSFKKGFDKDISPATISSWIKQTVILCYELSDQRASTLPQVKAHYVRVSLLPRPSNQESPWENHVNLPLEVIHHLHTTLSEGCGLGPPQKKSPPPIRKTNKKTQQNIVTCFFREVYFLGLNSSLFSPTSEQVCTKRGDNISDDRP